MTCFSYSPTKDPSALGLLERVMDSLKAANENFREDKDASPEALFETWLQARAVLAIMVEHGYPHERFLAAVDRAIKQMMETCAEELARRGVTIH